MAIRSKHRVLPGEYDRHNFVVKPERPHFTKKVGVAVLEARYAAGQDLWTGEPLPGARTGRQVSVLQVPQKTEALAA